MSDNVIRFCDFERRSKQPDAVQSRDPCEADVIVPPVLRIERPRDKPHDNFPANDNFPAMPRSQ